jgi:hypothetical protein
MAQNGTVLVQYGRFSSGILASLAGPKDTCRGSEGTALHCQCQVSFVCSSLAMAREPTPKVAKEARWDHTGLGSHTHDPAPG